MPIEFDPNEALPDKDKFGAGEKYWLAINGSSAATFPRPCQFVRVTQTPELLIGFETCDEQRTAQKIMLEAPINEVREFIAKLPTQPDVTIKCYKRPEPPSNETMWSPLKEDQDGDELWPADEFINQMFQDD